jgi:hypothetical protein
LLMDMAHQPQGVRFCPVMELSGLGMEVIHCLSNQFGLPITNTFRRSIP